MVLRHEKNSERGATLVIVALLIVAFCAITAVVVDIGNARQVSRHSQASADAAALAGAQDLPTVATAIASAARYVNENLTGNLSVPATGACPTGAESGSTCYAVGRASVAIKTPYDDPSSIPPARLVYVRICEPTDTFFAGVIGATSPTVCRQAVARRVNAPSSYGAGLIALSRTACPGLTLAGDSATTLSSNGAVLVNSSCDTAMSSNGVSWDLDAGYIGIAGESALGPCAPPDNRCVSVPPTILEEGIPQFDDPFNYPVPTPPLAVQTCPSGAGPNAPRIINPGRYPLNCSYNATAGKPLVLRSGLYYFNAGFTFGGAGPIVCSDEPVPSTPFVAADCASGVTIVVAGGAFDIGGGSQLLLPPPTTGPYAGLSLYQMSGVRSTLRGTSDFTMGTLYAPNAPLDFRGTGEMDVTGSVVGATFDIFGTFDFNITVPANSPVVPGVVDIGLES